MNPHLWGKSDPRERDVPAETAAEESAAEESPAGQGQVDEPALDEELPADRVDEPALDEEPVEPDRMSEATRPPQAPRGALEDPEAA